MNDAENAFPQAKSTLQAAYNQLKNCVTVDNAITFQSTKLEDVSSAARELERNLADRQELRNFRRLEQLFRGFKGYSNVCGILFQDTPFLPWLWAPVTLILQKSADHISALEHIASAYKRIAATIPTFDEKLSSCWNSAKGQQILAVFYADILEFHHQAICILERPGWARFFNVSWNRFKPYFQGILDELATYNDFVRTRAATYDIAYTQKIREEWRKEAKTQEAEHADTQRKNVESWLASTKIDQEDELDELLGRCHEGSCDWINENPKIKSWNRRGADHSVLWLKGKPGSGKSVLCAKLVQRLQGSEGASSEGTTVLYFLCTEGAPESKQCRTVVRALVGQLIQRQPDLCGIIQDEFVRQGHQPSVLQIRRLLPVLISAFSTVRIIIDGLDECDEKQQRSILAETTALAGCNGSLNSCKVLISSQDLITISRTLSASSCIDLSLERAAIQNAISSFVRSKIMQTPLLSDIESDVSMQAAEIERKLVSKADGMFLWVHLVISMLENAYSIGEMKEAVEDLPEGLDKVYDRIFARFRPPAAIINTDRACRIFQWLICSQRPLKKFELRDAVTLHSENTIINDDTRVSERVFELCKPLVESGPNDIIRFVHVSVKEYLLKYRPLFDMITAKYNVCFSCLAYLNFSVNLIDPEYGEESCLVEVGKGFHGLCRYASKYWVEHLLAYLAVSEDSGGDTSKETIMKAADNLALCISSIVSLSPLKNAPARLDERCRYLDGREPTLSLVMFTIEAQIKELIVPRNDSSARPAENPFSKIRQKYDEISKRLFQDDTVPGLDEETVFAFRKSYGSSILICRFSTCPRGARGFQTSEERDAHEKTHLLDLRCPYPECSVNRIGERSAKKFKLHLEQFHPEHNKNESHSSSWSAGFSRVRTSSALVSPMVNDDRLERDSEISESEDEDDMIYIGFEDVPKTDLFALKSTRWA